MAYAEIVIQTGTAAGEIARIARAATSGRPVLVLPSAAIGAIGHHVLLAWRESPGGWRALTAATPFLKAAETLWVVQTAPDPTAFTASDGVLEDYLRGHGLVPVMVRRCAASASRAVLETADACGADLMVMDLELWRELATSPGRQSKRRWRSAALIAA
jgi:hypothetical protein